VKVWAVSVVAAGAVAVLFWQLGWADGGDALFAAVTAVVASTLVPPVSRWVAQVRAERRRS